MPITTYQIGSAGSTAGFLKLFNNVVLSNTLVAVSDSNNVASPLSLSLVNGTFFRPTNTATTGSFFTFQVSNLINPSIAGNANHNILETNYDILGASGQTGTINGIYSNAVEGGGVGSRGYTHNLLHLLVNGVSRFRVTNTGDTIQTNSAFITGAGQFVSASRFRGSNAFFFLIEGSANGIALLTNSTQNGFDRLQFGGTTNLFPAIKRNGASIQFVLADDSGNANILCNLASSTIVSTTRILAASLPTTRPATVGEFYQDTAANILANGDKVVGIRQ
jgi:hypothetical protein